MAERLIFHYQDRGTCIHSLDPRGKILSLFLLTYTIFAVTPPGLAVILLYLAGISAAAGLPLLQYVRELLVFLVLGAAIAAGRLLAGESAAAAAIASGRFFLIVWAGLLLMDTTSPEKSSQAIYAFLRPLPWVNRGKAAAQFLLTITFIPLVFDSAREIREARYSRGENPKRRPFRFLLSFTAQLFDVLFLKAEEISMALLSRGFRDSMYPGKLTFRTRDAAAIGFSIIAASAAFGGSWLIQNL